jgi:hypothetical protein
MIRQHTDVKKWTCERCEKRFSMKHDLEIHIKRHLGIKDYKCQHCLYRCVTPKDLAEHIKRHDREKKYPIACIMQDAGCEIWKEGAGALKCTIRTKTSAHMDYHVQKNHTLEGLSQKLESETKLAKFFDAQGVPFYRDWENIINFRSCQGIEGNRFHARPDFYLPTYSAILEAVVIVGNDEFAHRRYACDFQRVFNIVQSLQQTENFKDVPLLYIRFNPHFCKKDGTVYDLPLDVKHVALMGMLQSLKKEDLPRNQVSLVYMYYDITNDELDVFKEDETNDYAKLYKDCVLRII